MAAPKRACVTHVEQLTPWTRRIICEMVDPEKLEFTGGQYIIVNSGIPLPSGKMGKRAYSIPSSDCDLKRFELVVRRIPEGVGSGYIHSLAPGNFLEFSGPWGKYLPPKADSDHSGVLVIATDTGLSAALGLVNGSKFSRFLPQTQLLWFVDSDQYFMPMDLAADRMPKGIQWRTVYAPPIGDGSRIAFCLGQLESLMREKTSDWIYLSGDGQVLSALEDLFLTQGYRQDQIVTEAFFNHSELKTTTVL